MYSFRATLRPRNTGYLPQPLKHSVSITKAIYPHPVFLIQTRKKSNDSTPSPSVRHAQTPPFSTPYSAPSSSSSTTTTKPDWSAAQYLKFSSERTRPVHDIISRIPLPASPSNTSRPLRIIDLGCGPGTSTAILYHSYPGARITGIDSSTDMLDTAREKLSHIDFVQLDLNSYQPPSSSSSSTTTSSTTTQTQSDEDGNQNVDLFFSNAVFHWFTPGQRVGIWTKLMHSLRSGGTLAFQVPDNADEPSHVAMQAVADEPGSVWRATLEAEIRRRFTDGEQTGTAGEGTGLGNAKMQRVNELYDLFAPFCSSSSATKNSGSGEGKERVAGGLDIWRTTYHHILPDHAAIVEWVKGTGLKPFIDPLPKREREAYLKRYKEVLEEVYPKQKDGKVILRYPRLFVVAVKA